MMTCTECKADYNEDEMVSLDFTDKDTCIDCFKKTITSKSTTEILEMDVEKSQDWENGITTLIFPFGRLVVEGSEVEWR